MDIDLADVMHEYAGVRDIAKRLGVHAETVRRLIRDGQIPGTFLFLNRHVIRRSDLELFAATYHPKPGRRPKALGGG